MSRPVIIQAWFVGILFCYSILCPLASAQSSNGMNITLVDQRNRTVALASNVTFTCQYTSTALRGVEYEWRYWELCTTGQKPSFPTALVLHGQAQPELPSTSYSFEPVSLHEPLPLLQGTGRFSLTIVNASAVVAATKCLAVVFSCGLTNMFGGRVSDDVLVNFYDPAHIAAATYVQLEVKEHSSVQVPCEAAGLPTPKQRWTKAVDGQPSVLPFGGYAFEGELPPFLASVQSAGNYTCFVSNDYGNASKTIEVVVKYKPIVEAVNLRVAQATGYYASLVCKATSGEPVTAAWWQHNGHVIARSAVLEAANSNSIAMVDQKVNATNHDRVIMKNLTVSGVHYTSELLLGVVHSDYHQVYTCHFANSAGASSAAMELIPSSKPRKTYSDGGPKPYRGEASGSAILRASLLLLLLGFLLHDLF